jgi:hypothetical protein
MANIRVGRPDITPDATSHVKGVAQGNHGRRQRGVRKDGTADARRSTGISPRRHNAILVVMPNIPPG